MVTQLKFLSFIFFYEITPLVCCQTVVNLKLVFAKKKSEIQHMNISDVKIKKTYGH